MTPNLSYGDNPVEYSLLNTLWRDPRLPDKVWNKIDAPIHVDMCWLWDAADDGKGYGKVLFQGKHHRVHRLLYLSLVGPIPAELSLDHLCRVRRCVNPLHLEPVTHAENMRRGAHANKTHCPRGHEYSGNNLRIYRGGRHCIQCRADFDRARYQAKRNHGR